MKSNGGDGGGDGDGYGDEDGDGGGGGPPPPSPSPLMDKTYNPDKGSISNWHYIKRKFHIFSFKSRDRFLLN